MKTTGTILLIAITAIWLFLTNVHYNGLNSIQSIASYHNGILSLKPVLADKEQVLQKTGVDARIYIDTLGIPHIFGGKQEDVAYSIGYMHARDRYFQMELTACTVRGELASMLGEPGMESDRQWRRLDLEEKAEKQLENLKTIQPELYHYLKAYEKGVNDYISKEPIANRDPLYTIWHYSPRPWKASNVFLIQWYMSYQLAFYDDYVNRQEILDRLPDTIRQLLYPVDPGNKLSAITGNGSRATLKGEEKTLVKLFNKNNPNNYTAQDFNRSLGSNNWVMDSSHTSSGEVFLCNDLHLQLTSPSILYEMHLSCPGMQEYGYSIPGVPLILTGHNENIAWGITNGGWDVTEQYLLKIDPQRPDHYWLDGKWQAMTEKKFIVHVKDGHDETMVSRYTVFGPLVKKDSLSYALLWHPVRSCDAVESFWKLMHAADWNSFREALRKYDYPSQNFVYADVKGNIGMICAGKMPVKPAGYSGGLLDGTVSPAYQYIDFDSLPLSYNPSKGYLFSANQAPEVSHHYYSSRWYDDLYRPARINEMLSGEEKFNREQIRKMQLDIKDLSAGDLKMLLNKYYPDKQLSDNWETMRNWDGVLSPDNKQSVFFMFFRRAARQASNELAKRINVKSGLRFDQFMNFLSADNKVQYAGSTLDSRAYFDRTVKIADSLFIVLNKPVKVNPYIFHVQQMTYLPGFQVDVNDIGGSDNTINVNYGAHPVIRTLVEVSGGVMQSWMVNATGQTGRLNDRNYFQQFNSWKKNELHKSQFTSNPNELQAIAESIKLTN
jgi:penicillin amidase